MAVLDRRRPRLRPALRQRPTRPTPPVAVPTHFSGHAGDLLVHLARPNPVWTAVENDPHVLLTVLGDHAFIPGPWRAEAGTPPTDGVPTG